LRAGLFYDQNPINDEWFSSPVPDSDREGITLGTGYSYQNITVDLAFMYIHFRNRTIGDSIIDDLDSTTPNALNGTYKSEALVAGITLGYKFK
jgi:long-chain fatty acid transport protein